MGELPEYLKKYTKYKWEFLRRNRKYIDDYKRLHEILDKEQERGKPDAAEIVAILGVPAIPSTKDELEFCRKWGISKPLPPHVSYDEIIQIAEKPSEKQTRSGRKKSLKEESLDLTIRTETGVVTNDGIDFHRLMYYWLHRPEQFSDRPIRAEDGWDYKHDGVTLHQVVSDKVAETGKLIVQLDLKYSKNRLMREFKSLLDGWKGMYEDAFRKLLYRKFCEERGIWNYPISDNLMGEFEETYKQELKRRQQGYEKKHHIDNFDDYLKVYDFRQKRTSWAKITSTLGLNGIQTARNHYRSARELIEKGIDLYAK